MGNGYVIKVAKNRAGIAQNNAEYNISQYVSSGLFAKVVQVSYDFTFLIMEEADKIDSMLRYGNILMLEVKKDCFS